MTPRAETTGRDFEDLIAKTIEQHDIDYERQVHIGETIYGTKRIVDFMINLPGYPQGLVVQAKYQTSSGSVDEKYPYEVACVGAGELPTVIVIGGGGYKQQALEWLKGQAGTSPNLVAVLEEVGAFSRFLAGSLRAARQSASGAGRENPLVGCRASPLVGWGAAESVGGLGRESASGAGRESVGGAGRESVIGVGPRDG